MVLLFSMFILLPQKVINRTLITSIIQWLQEKFSYHKCKRYYNHTTAINLHKSGRSLILGMCYVYTWSLLYPVWVIKFSRNHTASVKKKTHGSNDLSIHEVELWPDSSKTRSPILTVRCAFQQVSGLGSVWSDWLIHHMITQPLQRQPDQTATKSSDRCRAM